MSDLRCFGGGRDADNTKSLWFAFNRAPTDDELRFLLDCVQRAAHLVDPPAAGQKTGLRLVDKDGPI